MESYPTTSDDLARRREQARQAELKAADHRRRVLHARIVLLPILALALMAWPNFGIAKVLGHSMEPRYEPGDTLVLLRTYKLFSPVKPGDVVVIKLRHGSEEGEQIVKRVMFVQNATGNALWPKYLPAGRGDVPALDWFPGEVTGRNPVPANSMIVMGDNIMNSMDSRDFGPVFQSEIIGKVLNP